MTLRKTILAAALLLGAHAAAFGDDEPVGLWTFSAKNDAMVQDTGPYACHGIVRGARKRGPGPGGRAIYFDGDGNYVVIPDRAPLRVTKAVTLDVWVKLPEPALGREQCVVDKGGERYRIQISAGGAACLGLKCAKARGDISGGQLKPDTWHRITGVFQRPTMELYLDGRKVAGGTWDHDIGPGKSLFFGAKSGATYFMKGWLADVRIYNVVRPPRPEDADRLKEETVAMAEPKLTVQADKTSVTVNTGPIQLTFDAKGHGGLSSVNAGKKPVVRDNKQPPLFASLMESKEYDGRRDHVADARIVDASCRLVSFEHSQEGDKFSATTQAELTWPDGDRIAAELRWEASAGSPHLRLDIKLTPEGAFANRFLRELGAQLPLALNVRKRIAQGGDQGWLFDTRHYYQFHMDTKRNLMVEPGHNWWRHFMVEQDSPTHFRAWRAESKETAALTAQHGHRAPGWIAAYDQEGGMLCAYHKMHERTPKAVYVNAENGGLARVCLHPATARALPIHSPQAKQSLFSSVHRTDWVWFTGELPFAQPTRTLAEAWGEETLASDPPARPEIVEIDLWNAPEATGDRIPLVMGGLPLPKGAIDKPDQVRLFRKALFQENNDVPLQTRPLAYWPDGSIKWLLLIFPLDGKGGLKCESGTGEGKPLEFDVTLRRGEKERFRLLYGKQVTKGAVTSPLTARQEGNRIDINTGPLSLSLSTGERWLADVRLNGKPLLRANADRPLSFIDYLRTDRDTVYPVNTTHPEGALDPGTLTIDSIKLEESGPLRAMVRMEGNTNSKEPQRVILRVEAYTGRSAVRLFHSVEFLHKDPRTAFVRSMGLSLPLQIDAEEARLTAGCESGPKQLDKVEKTGLSQRNHLRYALWQQPADRQFPTDVDAARRCRGWLSMADKDGGCAVVVRNMWQEYPKEIVADPETGQLDIGLWPESHALMDVRRYSNYPHPSQGESAGRESSWVDKTYYPNHPFVGVSKTHELLLFFHDRDTAPDQIDAVAADFQSQPLVYVTPEWYASVGVSYPYPAPDMERFPLMEKNLERVTDFWLFHQKIWAWYGMWDYGDVMHKFSGWGYGWILPPDYIAELLKMPADKRHAIDVSGKRIYDYHTQTDWCFDNGRWGWGNTEGNPGLFLQMQYLRTGRRDWFFAAEAMARHTRDVDMRHDGKWFGKGTRHGVQHWSDGNHEERQTVHSEWRFHHYLTGDMRSRDFAKQLTEGIYAKTRIRIHAAHSGRLYGLLTRWEMTGDPKLGDLLKRYVHTFIVPEGIAISPSLQFSPEFKQVGKPGDVNGESMFFHTFGGMHALLEYYELTRDAALKDALIRMADHAIGQPRRTYTFRKVIIFAAKYADDPAPYRKVLDDWITSSANYHLFNMVSDTPKHWTGETAYLRPGVSGQWFWLNDVLYLMWLLDREPEPTEKQRAAFDDMNTHGRRGAFARESWQAEYDRPDLKAFLRDQRLERKGKE